MRDGANAERLLRAAANLSEPAGARARHQCRHGRSGWPIAIRSLHAIIAGCLVIIPNIELVSCLLQFMDKFDGPGRIV